MENAVQTLSGFYGCSPTRLNKKRKSQAREERQIKKRKSSQGVQKDSQFKWGIPGESLPSMDPELTARSAAEAKAEIERGKSKFLERVRKLPSAAVLTLLQHEHYNVVTGLGEAVPNQLPRAP